MAPLHCRWLLWATLYCRMCLRLQSHGTSAKRWVDSMARSFQRTDCYRKSNSRNYVCIWRDGILDLSIRRRNSREFSHRGTYISCLFYMCESIASITLDEDLEAILIKTLEPTTTELQTCNRSFSSMPIRSSRLALILTVIDIFVIRPILVIQSHKSTITRRLRREYRYS
jgi:hypothetical protein